MIGFKRLIPFLCAATFLVQAPSIAEETTSTTTFDNQSTVGKELRIPVHHWYKQNHESKAIVVGVPGLVFNGRAYDVAARELVARGYELYSVDVRGYGDWKTNTKGEFDGDTQVHFGQTREDVTKVLQSLRQKNVGKPIFLIGESFGATYAVWEASNHPNLVDGVVAVGLPYRVCLHPRPRWFLTLAEGVSRPHKPMDLVPYLMPTLSENKDVSLAALNDNNISMKELSASDLIKAHVTIAQSTQNVANIPAEMPVLMMAGQKDAIQKTYRLPEVMQAMGSKHAHLVMLPNKGHLLLERKVADPDAMAVLTGWLEMQTQKLAQLGSISSTAPAVTTTPTD